MYPERQTFLVFGLSRSGIAAAEYLLKQGARVYVYDDVDSEAVEKNIHILVGEGAFRAESDNLERMYEKCDALVLSPGVPIDHKIAVSFRKNGRAVIGETEIAARFMKCPVIAITGTNGKTTTVSMIGKILNDSGKKAEVCGNIGTPMIKFASCEEKMIAVAEISSFQLETLSSLIPHIAIVLNITEDHLNRHYTMQNYIFLKKKLLKNSTETEYVILNRDDETVRGFAENLKAHILWFSLTERVRGAYFEEGYLCFANEKIMRADELLMEGAHNIANALAAICAAKIMGVSSESIKKSLMSFKGAKHRIEWVGEINGVDYIDDSKGTNTDATKKAIVCMKKPTIILLGGKDKGYNYDSLFMQMKDSKIIEAIIYGENRDKIYESAQRIGFENVLVCPTFAMATEIAVLIAQSGQAVLLSPASASFDEFESYEERGDRFVSFVREKEKIHESKEFDEEPSTKGAIALPVGGSEDGRNADGLLCEDGDNGNQDKENKEENE